MPDLERDPASGACSHITVRETWFIDGCYEEVKQEQDETRRKHRRSGFENTILDDILLGAHHAIYLHKFL